MSTCCRSCREYGYGDMAILLLRYSLIPVIAAAMSVVGWQLMFHFPFVWEFDRGSFGLILPSILLWAFLTALVRRTSPAGAVAVGIFSSVAGGLLGGGLMGLCIILSVWPIAFFTGGATGWLIHRCLFWGAPSRRSRW